MPFSMPAEYAPHEGTLLIWPTRPGSWGNDPTNAQQAFLEVIRAIAEDEQVWLLAGGSAFREASQAVKALERVTVLNIETDDAWARDVGPTVVKDEAGNLQGISWSFNAWGGSYNGLYAQWDKDDSAADRFCNAISLPCRSLRPFVLEGGSIHSDGDGTLMATESCLLSPGRNPSMSKQQIEQTLLETLGAQKMLWLPRGIFNDETDEHVDNVCAFIGPAEVVLAWTDDESDPQYPLSFACLQYLQSQTDAKGRSITVHKLPIPKVPITLTQEDVEGYTFEPGEDTREIGERLAASYVNFYFTNHSVLVPQFGGVNQESDLLALQILKDLCPDRRVVGIPARCILMGGGNIHCITQQIPKGVVHHG